jgi:hypothetical protein
MATTFPLPFGEQPVLEVVASFSALLLEPVGPSQVPMLLAGQGPHPEEPDVPVSVQQLGNTVQVRVGGRFGWPPWGRKQGFRLLVPPHLRARVHCDAGQILAERLMGCDLDLSAGAGQIRLEDVHGRMALRADAGQIRGERLGGTFEVESSAGEVRLELAPGLRVRIEARTSMGSTRNRYPTTADAEATLAIETDLGSVRIDSGGRPLAQPVDDWRARWGGGGAWSGRGPFFSKPTAEAPPPPRPASAVSHGELRRILEMVEQGKINAEEADRLIRAMEGR